MGRIAISGMRFYAHHGCFGEERAIGTHFLVDLQLEVDTSAAEISDNIDDTVNYLKVYQVVKQEMERPSNLLEHVAHRVGEAVLSQFSDTKSVVVKMSKLNPPLGGQMESASVEIALP